MWMRPAAVSSTLLGQPFYTPGLSGHQSCAKRTPTVMARAMALNSATRAASGALETRPCGSGGYRTRVETLRAQISTSGWLIHVFNFKRTRTHTCTHAHTHTRKHTRAHTHTHTHTQPHKRPDARVHTNTLAYIRTAATRRRAPSATVTTRFGTFISRRIHQAIAACSNSSPTTSQNGSASG